AGGPSDDSAGGGADVSQEWGVVKASLRQQLLIPSVAHTGGIGNASWQTDVILRNPESVPVFVGFEFAPSGGSRSGDVTNGVLLLPGQIRVVPDVVRTVLHQESGFGSVFLDVSIGTSIEATSRTYTATTQGSFGMGVGAVELVTGALPGFPLTFASGLQGRGYRTNLVLADVSGRGARASLRLASQLPNRHPLPLALSAPAWGPMQLSAIESTWEDEGREAGSFILDATSGAVVPLLVSIDDRTNDPTYFPPDLSGSVERTIPAIVHTRGANGADFQSDLFLVNPSDQTHTVTLTMTPWDNVRAQQDLTLTFLPYESRTIKDVLGTLFARTGVAKLTVRNFWTGAGRSTDAVRATSRTYTTDSTGGTYGMLLPPLNAFQSVGPGEALTILGTIGGAGFRTNLALVELSPAWIVNNVPAASVRVEISDGQGVIRDAFDVAVPTAGGMQLNDLFRARGLGAGPEAALIRVTAITGQVAAYATLIDQLTNDSTYFAAVLAAR
ncbi:MAG: hypothetical protein ABIT01_17485, partial [Thermoanaerobaculia bacterium]